MLLHMGLIPPGYPLNHRRGWGPFGCSNFLRIKKQIAEQVFSWLEQFSNLLFHIISNSDIFQMLMISQKNVNKGHLGDSGG